MLEPTPASPWWMKLLSRPMWLVLAAFCLVAASIAVPWWWRWQETSRMTAELALRHTTVRFEHAGPQWLRNIVGDNWMRPFDVPESVLIESGSGLTDADFRAFIVPLNELRGFKRFESFGSELTEPSFAELAKFEHLAELSVSEPAFNDRVLAHFSSAQRLQSLDLGSTRVTDAGLQHLRELKNLEYLSVSNTDVSEQGLEELQRHLPQLVVSDD